MRLYLSSYQLGNSPETLKDLVGSNRKTAIIMNAGDALGNDDRPRYLKKFQKDLKDLDLDGEELDLRNYFSDNSKLKEKFQNYGAIYAVGGNAFTLLRAMVKSGFDNILRDLLSENSLVYSGFSAGGCVLAPTMKGLELVDKPELVPHGYEKEIIWEGLNIVDFCFAPHYRSNHHESEDIEKVVEYYRKNSIKHYALRDGEAIVINDNNFKIVGSNNE